VTTTRREFLVLGLGWFPFFWRRPRSVRLAGAEFRVVRRGRSPNRYLHIHGNEETARRVLDDRLVSTPGTYFLIRNNVRNVPVRGGQLDPNRMFSRTGAEANLKRLNPKWSPAEIARTLGDLDRGRNKLLHALLPPPGGRLVALHNNSAGYSVRDEVEISDRTSLRQPDDPHAFFLCTSPDDYAILAASPYNVVLQQHGPKDDDGSLSRLAARRGVRYINLEVGLGNFARQKEMLDWLERRLP
jgi:hypothetical protein